MRAFRVVALAASLAVGGFASAEFVEGNPIAINGSAGPQDGGTTFGTWAGQGLHILGDSSTYWDDLYDPTDYTIEVTSEVLSPYHLRIEFNFSDFEPAYYTFYDIEILDLKNDGTLDRVDVNQGQAKLTTDNNGVTWKGFGRDLDDDCVLTFDIYQRTVPAPGAAAILGLASLLAGARRRRR